MQNVFLDLWLVIWNDSLSVFDEIDSRVLLYSDFMSFELLNYKENTFLKNLSNLLDFGYLRAVSIISVENFPLKQKSGDNLWR